MLMAVSAEEETVEENEAEPEDEKFRAAFGVLAGACQFSAPTTHATKNSSLTSAQILVRLVATPRMAQTSPTGEACDQQLFQQRTFKRRL